MKINWKVRFQNKTWVLTFCAAALTLVYQVLSVTDVIPKLPKDTVFSLFGAAVDLLVMLGVIVDPTTKGASDSVRALSYDVPAGEEDT